MIKLALNMHLWHNEIQPQHLPQIAQFKEIGYDGIEVFLAEPEKTNIKELRKVLQDMELECLAALGVGVDNNPASTDAKVRARGLASIKRAIDALQELGGHNLCGPFHSAHAFFSRSTAQESELAYSAEVLYEAAEYAKQADITLTPEALNRFECYLLNTMQQLRDFVQRINHSHLKGMFDTHHAHIEEKSQRQAILDIQPVLHYVHVSENDRGTPGKGQVHWDEVFQTLHEINYSGWITIEAFSRDNEAFANAINVWRNFSPRDEITSEGLTFIKQYIQKYLS